MSLPVPPSAPWETPIEDPRPRIGPASTHAAGLKGVLKTAQFAWGQAGVVAGSKLLLQVNQKDGFDCQSCAWPSPDRDRHGFEFCENGAKAVADEAMRGKVDAAFFARHSIADLAARSDHWLNAQGRLTEPMIRKSGASHYAPISWADANAAVASALHACATPDEAAFYTSGRTSNEAAFLYQLFARRFGTNNLPDCSNMCHESSGAALHASIGIGKGTVTLEDFDAADLILVVGQNPGTNHPRMLAALQSAKANGAKIISINPLPEVGLARFKNPQDFKSPQRSLPTLLSSGTVLHDLWLQPRIQGDMAVFKGIMKCLLAREDAAPGTVFDHAFIREFTSGYEAVIADLRAAEWSELEEGSGIARRELEAAADMVASARRMICCWAMGLTQQPSAVDTIRTVVNLHLLGGHIGRPGAGVCPVRGHSNVQGDRTMGIWEKMPAAWLDRLDAVCGGESPQQHGFDTVDAIRAMAAGRVGVFFGLGGNFLSATPDTHFTARALERCRLTVQVSTKLNRGHLVTGETALILPCLGRSERDADQFVTVEDSMGIINSSRGTRPPASEHLRSEPAIIAGVAEAVLGPRSGNIEWAELAADYGKIRDLIAGVVPGFADFNTRIARDIFYLPNGPRDDRRFATASARAEFAVAPLPDLAVPPGRFVMMTIRSHDQFNTTIYGLDDRYRGIYGGRRVAFMAEADIADLGLMAGQWVDLHNDFGGTDRWARHFMVAPYALPRGSIATYFPEANALVPLDSVAAISNTPTSKYVIVRVLPSADPVAAAAAWKAP